MFDPILTAHAREVELDLAARKILQRQEWETLQTVDRLEKQLQVARGRLNISAAPQSA